MKTILRLLILIVLLPMSAWADEPVRIGVLLTRPKPMIQAQWQPLADKLKQKIPGRGFVIEALDFKELDAAVSSRNLDFVLTNPGNYVLLAQRYGLSSPLATLVQMEDGKPQEAFGGVMFTLSGRDDIKRLEDVRGKRVSMVDIESMGAYQMQAYELALKGVSLPQDARLTATGMPHDKVVQAVLDGEADVGFVRTGILEAMNREGKLDLSKLKILNRQDLPGLPWALSTRLYPERPFAAMPQVDKALAGDVASALFQLHEDTAVVRRIGIYGFTIPADYRVVENLLRKLRLPPFDVQPEFTWQDVWHKYSIWIIFSALAGTVILVLLLVVWRSRQHLREERLLVLREGKLYETLLKTAGDGIHVLDLEGNVLEANEAFCRMLGCTQNELRGMNVTQWDAQMSPEELGQAMRELGEGSRILETRHRRRDGSLLDVEVNVAGVEIGGKRMLFCAARDITARKRAEEELRLAKVFSETLIDSLPGIFYRLDAEGRLLGWNHMLETLLGEEGLRQAQLAFLNVIHEDDRPAVAVCRRRGMEQGYSDVEARLVLKNGKTPWFYFVGRSLALGNQVYMLGTGMDISERRAAEEALRRSNADLEQFAYSVSHDMRAPLRVVSGHLQLLQRSLKDKLDEDDRENLAFALDGAKRMDGMILSLLEYSRVGRIADAQLEFSAREPFDEAMDFLAPAIRESQAEITATGEWPEVYASRDELTRLFQNLIGNALHYREPGKPPRVEVESSVLEKTWRVSVRDHGIGIAPEQIERLFKFFSRLHARSRFEGTGMGLALCRRIVERHHGRIWVESEGEGNGSTFIFEMPLQREGMEGGK